MPITGGVPPSVLIATVRQQALASALLEGGECTVIHVQSAALALEQSAAARPDAIILEADLPDMSGIEVCRLLHADPRVGYRVPILLLAAAKPTPEQRVAALRAGAWDFFVHPADPEELSLKLQTYVQAKRNIDVAAAEGLVDPVTGLLSRPGLARRARELGALMTRKHGALACVVFAVDTKPPEPNAGDVVARAARVSDVVGVLTPTEPVVIAPATGHAGAVKLAERVTGVLRDALGGAGQIAPGSTLLVGYDAVANLGYSPIDPAELLTHATAAVKSGIPDPGSPWVRSFDLGGGSQPRKRSGPEKRSSRS